MDPCVETLPITKLMIHNSIILLLDTLTYTHTYIHTYIHTTIHSVHIQYQLLRTFKVHKTGAARFLRSNRELVEHARSCNTEVLRAARGELHL